MEDKNLKKEDIGKVSGGILGFGKKDKRYTTLPKKEFTTHSGKQVEVTAKKDNTTGRIIRVRTLKDSK